MTKNAEFHHVPLDHNTRGPKHSTNTRMMTKNEIHYRKKGVREAGPPPPPCASSFGEKATKPGGFGIGPLWVLKPFKTLNFQKRFTVQHAFPWANAEI